MIKNATNLEKLCMLNVCLINSLKQPPPPGTIQAQPTQPGYNRCSRPTQSPLNYLNRLLINDFDQKEGNIYKTLPIDMLQASSCFFFCICYKLLKKYELIVHLIYVGQCILSKVMVHPGQLTLYAQQTSLICIINAWKVKLSVCTYPPMTVIPYCGVYPTQGAISRVWWANGRYEVFVRQMGNFKFQVTTNGQFNFGG